MRLRLEGALRLKSVEEPVNWKSLDSADTAIHHAARHTSKRTGRNANVEEVEVLGAWRTS